MPTGVSNDGSSTFSNKVAPLPPEDLLFTEDYSSLTIVGIEDNDDAQGPGEIHPNRSVMSEAVYQCPDSLSMSINPSINMPINAYQCLRTWPEPRIEEILGERDFVRRRGKPPPSSATERRRVSRRQYP